MVKNLLVVMISLAFLAVPAFGADSKQAADATKSLQQIASEVKDLLAREKVRNVFDLFRRLQEHGATWQPELCAPNDLVGKLGENQLRGYAGMKLFDAVYAAAFMQRQAVSDAVQTIEAIHDKLNLRAYADLKGKYFATLKKASAEPESVNVQQLMDQLAEDYVQDIPVLMSSPQGADYLVESLYGFSIEAATVLQYFYDACYGRDCYDKIAQGYMKQPDRTEWWKTVADLFDAFDRLDEQYRNHNKTTDKAEVFKRMVALTELELDKDHPAAAQRPQWQELKAKIRAARTAVLTPSSK